MPQHNAREPQVLDSVTRQVQDALADEAMVAYLRFLIVRDYDGRWVLGFGRIDLCRDGDMDEGPRYDYLQARTLAFKIPGKDFLKYFGGLFSGDPPCLIDGVPLGPLPTGRWEVKEFWSDNEYASWPCVHAELQMETQAIDATKGPFVSARGFPYCDNVYELVQAIAGFGTFYFNRDARRRNLHLIIWKYRGRFSALDFQDSKLQISVEGRLLERFQVSGRVLGYDWEKQFRYPAHQRLDLPLQEQPLRVEAALVAEDDEIVDLVRHDLDALVQRGTDKMQSTAELIDKCLRHGESATVEYKPFVSLEEGEAKREEILETVLAMANAQGGYVLLGVNDQGVPQFNPDAWKAIVGRARKGQGEALPTPGRREDLEKAVAAYGVRLRDFIQKRVNRSLALPVHVEFKESSPILVLVVGSGGEKPYMDVRDNSVWFRANATNRRPSEAELEQLFHKQE